MNATVLSPAQRATVRAEVADLLTRSPAFQALPSDTRAEVERNTAAIVEAMAPRSEQGGPPASPPPAPRGAPRPPAGDPYSEGLADQPPFDPFAPHGPSAPPPAPATPPAPPEKWTPDERFQAEGVVQGVTQVGRMIKEVDFPGFVSSLVKGTFNAVVDASIQQMKAYAELVQSVAASIGDFRDQNVSEAQGRSHLVQKYPKLFKLGPDKKGRESVQLQDDVDTDALPDFQKEFGLASPVGELDQDALNALVQASRDNLASSRQQLLATTIMMGINRIIVTDGKINAKLRFDFSAHDTLTRTGTVEEKETEMMRLEFEGRPGSQFARGVFEKPVPIKVSSTTATTTADLEASGRLTGEVSLNFRSETFPLQEMVTTDQMFKLRQARGEQGPPAAAPSAPVASSAPTTR